jgi:hypothetical protein
MAEEGQRSPTPAVARSWQYLSAFLDLCPLLAAALRAHHLGAGDAIERAWEVFHWVRERERDLQPVLDVFEFQNTLGPRLGISREELEARP